MLQIYNNLTSKKEPFTTIEENHVKMYVCGVTVYDDCHIGHARTYIAFDIVVRYLRYLGYKVTYVRNITDIDDKIIKRAHKNNELPNELVERYINNMYRDFDALGINRPDFEPKATETIVEMLDFIQILINKGYAYKARNGDVYYRVKAFKEYGKLSKQNIEALNAGMRVEVSTEKENPLDFTLWKASKPGEPEWESPWSKGRPGWHIECSAMAKKILGDTFDIHAGGSDLKFPHHENEIAQSEAANGCQFARLWMHSGMVQINAEKMSKSLHNFFLIKDVLHEYKAEVIRYFLISGHYRSEINYSCENLENAKVSLTRLYTSLRGIKPANKLPKNEEFTTEFKKAMDNDFNTPEALSVLFGIAKEINCLKLEDMAEAQKYAKLLLTLSAVLGLLTQTEDEFFKDDKKLDKKFIDTLIQKRLEAKKDKNWVLADKLRNDLKAIGIVLEDTGNGTIWKKEN